MTKDVAKKNDTDVALFDQEAPQGGSGLGNEDVGAGDMQTPQLKLIQKASHEMNEASPRFIAEAKPGQWCNSVTNELYDTVLVANLKLEPGVSIFRSKDHRDGMGSEGFFPSQELADKHVADKFMGDTSFLTFNKSHRHTVVILNPKGQPQCVAHMYMSKSQLKVSLNWNTQIGSKEAQAGKRLDRFAGIWELSASTESNKDNSWKIPAVTFRGWAREGLSEQLGKLYSQNFGTPAAAPEVAPEAIKKEEPTAATS